MSSPIVDDGKYTLSLTVVSMSELQRIRDKADPMGKIGRCSVMGDAGRPCPVSASLYPGMWRMLMAMMVPVAAALCDGTGGVIHSEAGASAPIASGSFGAITIGGPWGAERLQP